MFSMWLDTWKKERHPEMFIVHMQLRAVAKTWIIIQQLFRAFILFSSQFIFQWLLLEVAVKWILELFRHYLPCRLPPSNHRFDAGHWHCCTKFWAFLPTKIVSALFNNTHINSRLSAVVNSWIGSSRTFKGYLIEIQASELVSQDKYIH